MKGLRVGVAAIAVAALAGCATVIQSNVRSYGAIPTKADGSRGTYFIFTPDKDRHSLERESFTDRVRAGLNRNGFKEARPDEADYAVLYTPNIRVSGSKGSYTAPITVGGNSAFAQGFNAASAASGGSVSSSDVCTRTLLLRLYPAGDITAESRPIYERRAISEGSSCDLGRVLPLIIDSIFETKNFPGENGKTYLVELPLKQ